MKKILIVAVICAGCSMPLFAENAADIGSARLKGYLGARLDALVKRHVSETDVDYITAPFLEKCETKGWWQTEFWGKWMHSAVPYLGYCDSEELRKSINRGVARILASQEANGYIGNYPDDRRCGEGWDVWGMKYTMMGLLHYYDLLEREEGKGGGGGQRKDEVLDACKRLCDYVIAEIGPNGRRGSELWKTGYWSGYASSSILEPVVWLYKRTHEGRYLDFATYLVKGMTEPEAGPRLLDLAIKGVSVADRNGHGNKVETSVRYMMKCNRWKAYEMMSCYQGMIEYYEVTGRRDLLDAAVATANDIIKEEINLAGGCSCSEAWFHGAKKQHLPYRHLQETCVTTTWMRFCEKLLNVTDDPKWADEMERTFYNAYLGAMKADGSEFAGYTPLSGNRYHGQHHCYMHTDCCTANGPRGYLCFLRELYKREGDTATVNFYTSALVDGFEMYSLYPRGSSVRIVSHVSGLLKLRLRIPGWSRGTVVRLNGKALDGVSSGKYFMIEKSWNLGDVVEIGFDLPVVAHIQDHSVAFTRGPVLLARDSRFDDGDLMEPFRNEIKDGDVMPTFQSIRTPSDDFWMSFSATLPIGAHYENPEGALPRTICFCDYASAGNTWGRDNYYRTWFPVELGPTE